MNLRSYRWSGLEMLESRLLLAAYEPTSLDQYLLELINRGRADPSAEAARYGIDLNEGLAADTISSAAKQPLAFNVYLNDSAHGHSQWMLDNNTFSHTGAGGSSSHDRMESAGYVFNTPWTSGENLGYKGTTGTLSSDDVISYTAQIHRNLFVDENYPGRGHRVNQMSADFREVGNGVVEGQFYDSGTNYNSVMVTENFAASGTDVFLTGVAYDEDLVSGDEADGDFYTPGEGLGSVSIRATNQSTSQVYTTTTWASGGYSLALPAGTYTVTASGGDLGVTVTYSDVVISTENVKRDFRPDMSDQSLLSINDVQVTEGDSGSSFASFTVTLSQSLSATVTVNYASADGTAIAGRDYAAVTGTISFSPGVTTQTIRVPVIGDQLVEPNQTFYVDLSGAVNASVTGTGRGTCTIVNDDSDCDFNQDGWADAVYRNAETGRVLVSLMSQGSVSSTVVVGVCTDLSWQIYGVGDWNGDSKVDLLWQNSATGDLSAWLMNGTSYSSSLDLGRQSDSQWLLGGCGDFNDDQVTDLLWQHTVNGQLSLWQVNLGGADTAVDMGTVGSDWTLAGVGRLNDDLMPDLLWRRGSDHRLVGWLMDPDTLGRVSGTPLMGTVPSTYRPAGIGLYTTGRQGIVWDYNQTTTASLWQLDSAGHVDQSSDLTLGS